MQELKTSEDVYDFIGELAIALYSKKIQISLGSLRSILLDKGGNRSECGLQEMEGQGSCRLPCNCLHLHRQGWQSCLGQRHSIRKLSTAEGI